MKLTNNIFKDTREINGFTQEEILDVKNNLSKFKTENTEQSEIDDYLNTKLLIPGIFEFYNEYLTEIDKFIRQYLLDNEKSDLISNNHLAILNEPNPHASANIG